MSEKFEESRRPQNNIRNYIEIEKNEYVSDKSSFFEHFLNSFVSTDDVKITAEDFKE